MIRGNLETNSKHLSVKSGEMSVSDVFQEESISRQTKSRVCIEWADKARSQRNALKRQNKLDVSLRCRSGLVYPGPKLLSAPFWLPLVESMQRWWR